MKKTSLQKNAYDILTISYIQFLEFKANMLLHILVSVTIPLGFMILLELIVGNLTEMDKIQFMSGALTTTIMVSSLNSLGQEVAADRFILRLKLFITRPVNPFAYGIGMLIGTSYGMFIGVGVILAYSILVWNVSIFGSIINFIVILLLSWLSLAGVALLVGANSTNLRQAMALLSVLSFGLIFITPIYYPIENLPTVVQHFARIIPATYVAMGIKNCILGRGIFIEVIALALTTLFTMFFSAKKLHWGAKYW